MELAEAIPEDLVCPLTHLIFRDPVAAPDGYVYEKEAIQQWVKQNSQSPTTREKWTNPTWYPLLMVKNRVADYLKKNPDAKQEQYPEPPPSLQNLLDNDFSEEAQIDLSLFTGRELKPLWSTPQMPRILGQCTQLLGRTSDNMILWKLAIEHAPSYVVSEFFARGLTMTQLDKPDDLNTPLHQAASYGSIETVRMMIGLTEPSDHLLMNQYDHIPLLTAFYRAELFNNDRVEVILALWYCVEDLEWNLPPQWKPIKYANLKKKHYYRNWLEKVNLEQEEIWVQRGLLAETRLGKTALTTPSKVPWHSTHSVLW